MEALLLPVSKLAMRTQHDLQMAGQLFFCEQSRDAAHTRPLVGRNLQQRRILPRDLGYRHITQEAHQLARKVCGTVAFAQQFVDQHQNLVTRALGNGLHHRFERTRGRRSDQASHRVERQMLGGGRNRLIENRQRVPHRAIARFGEQRQRIIVGRDLLLRGDVTQLLQDILKLDRPEAEVLAARTNRLRNILGLRRRHHENDVAGRLLQSLEQGIEGRIGDLVRFVENVDLEAVARWAVAGRVAQFADLVDPAVGGGVDFDHVDRVARANFGAGLAHSARFSRRLRSRPAVQSHGQDAGDGRLSDSPMPAEDVAVGDALLRNRILQGARDVFLADNVGEFLRTIFARQDLIAHRNF